MQNPYSKPIEKAGFPLSAYGLQIDTISAVRKWDKTTLTSDPSPTALSAICCEKGCVRRLLLTERGQGVK